MDAKLNYSDIVALFSEACGLSVADAEAFSTAFFELIVDGLEADGIVKINGLGTFKLIAVENRQSVNVNTGERFEIKGHKKLTFTPSDSLKDTVNAPFALFVPVEVEGEIEGTEETVADTADIADEDISEATIEVPTMEIREKVTGALPENFAQESAAQDVSVEEPSVAENEIVVKIEDGVGPDASSSTIAESKTATKNRSALISFAAIFIAILCLSIYALHVNDDSTLTATIADNAKVEKLSTAVDTEEKPIETVIADSVTNETAVEEQPFMLVDTLAKRTLAIITVKDTTDYIIRGTVAEHIVELEETLIKISLKHYGDKRLWPYIVQHNNLSKPNELACGMVLKIPRLVPRF